MLNVYVNEGFPAPLDTKASMCECLSKRSSDHTVGRVITDRGVNLEYRTLGKTDIRIPTILMGTWQTGQKDWIGIEDRDSTRAIQTAFETGINAFDTAEAYGKGHSERILGNALAPVRNRIVYITKVSPNHLKYDQVLQACHRSLKNLKTDYIDLYMVHWPAGSWRTRKIPIEETMRAMNDLKQQGKVRAIGISNFSFSQLVEAVHHGTIESLQIPYSLFWRHVERDSMSYCRNNKITILAYSPMAQGLLTGKFPLSHKFDQKDNRSRNKLFRGRTAERAHGALAKLRPIAERNNLTLGQLALAWVISQPGTSAIAGARNEEQVRQNAMSSELHLSKDDLREMDMIGRTVTDAMDDNPVMWD
jgi:myo-inositol catabolism protein IolS